MLSFSQSLYFRYAVAVALVVAALIGRWLLDPILENLFPFGTVFFAVLVAAWYGGFGPALLATVLGMIGATWLLLPPRGTLEAHGLEHQGGLVLNTAISLGIAFLGGAMRSAQERWRTTAAEAVRQRDEIRTALASIGDGVLVTDPHGRILSLNRVAERLTGWSAAAAIGQSLETVFVIVNEQTRQAIENPVQRVLREGMVMGLANHTLLIAKDGRETPIDDSGAPIRNEAGEITGVVLAFRDVSERKAAERVVRGQAQVLTGILAASVDHIYVMDRDARYLHVSTGAARVIGFEPHEIIGKHWRELGLPAEVITPIDRQREQVLHSGVPVLGETGYQTPQGEKKHFEYTIAPLRGEDGWAEAVVFVSRDITSRKRSDEDNRFLAQASAALAALVDYQSTLQKVARLAVPHFADWAAVDVLEDRGILRRVAVAHIDPAKVELAHELQRRFPPQPEEPTGVWNILRTGKSEIVPEITEEMLVAMGTDAERIDIVRQLGLKSYMGVPLNVRGKVFGVITFIAAESGRRYDSRDLALAEDLAHRAAVAIENSQLYQALREADRRKDEFLAMLAHELRNPLAPIRNALQVCKMAQADRPLQEQAREMMERQVEHLVRLVDDLLDVSRVMRGKIELKREAVALATVVRRSIETAQPVLDDHGHELTVSLPSEPIELFADPVRLAQVLTNLLTNAAKFTPKPDRIYLIIERRNAEIEMRVRDPGIGVPADHRERIFDLFAQVDHGIGRSRGGLGIGLTLVKSLVEMHGGTVQVHSEGTGRGSEFVVRLPEPVGQTLLSGGFKADKSVCPTQPAASKRRILVVDDNRDAADSLALLLRLRGQDVWVAYDGVAGLEAARAFRPDLVFLDIGMPGMNGYELARHIRQIEGLERVQLAAMTGWGQEEDRRRSREAGFDLHFVKPVEPECLNQLLAEAVN